MPADGALIRARKAAAMLLAERGYPREAALAAAGEGDDFAETRIAMALIRLLPDGEPHAAPAREKRIGRRLAGEEC